MTTLIGAATWLVSNWQIIATAFSSISSIALFFMHGNAAADLAELQSFVGSLQISQSQSAQLKKT